LITIFLALGMVIAGIIDIRTRKIPNLLTLPMMLLGLAYHGALGGLSGLGFSAAGLGAGLGVFLIPYILGGMGAGDAKLMGAAGTILGPTGVLIAAVMSVLIGFMYAIVLLFFHLDYTRSFLRRVGITVKTFFLTGLFVPVPAGSNPNSNPKQPVLSYALPIALGTMCYLFLKITGSDFIQNLTGFQFNL